MAKPLIPFALGYDPKKKHLTLWGVDKNVHIKIRVDSIPSITKVLRETHRQIQRALSCSFCPSTSLFCASGRKIKRHSVPDSQLKRGRRKPETVSHLLEK